MPCFLSFNLNKKQIKTLRINEASEQDFDLIKDFIRDFDLDNRDLKRGQFLVAKENNQLLGFGRIRKHKGCDEFCSLGVIKTSRFKGIAKALIKARIKISTQPIYLVCIIPEYFEKLGFVVVNEYPSEIADKLHYCISELTVPENYVVMKYSG